MRLKILPISLLLLAACSYLTAQTFVEQMGTPFSNLYGNAVTFADVDGDNDPDLLITGHSGDPRSDLYLNDGAGNFSLKAGTPFKSTASGSVAFADVNGDNNQDLLIAGSTTGNTPVSELYLNDGTGAFTLKANTPFEPVSVGSVSFADVDGDNDLDVFIAGRKDITTAVGKLYLNDGTGNFTEKTGTSFVETVNSAVAFGDVDGDNDQDLIVTGLASDAMQNLITTTRLYLNDGTGNFTEKAGTPFDGVRFGDVAFADVDGDGDQDVMLLGRMGVPPQSTTNISKLYLNDGSGTFSEKTGTPFVGVEGTFAVADYDGDNDADVLITGSNNSGGLQVDLFANDGAGNFTLVAGTPFTPVFAGDVAVADVDGNNSIDILISGNSTLGGSTPTTKLYTNTTNVSVDRALLALTKLHLYPNPVSESSLTVDFVSSEPGIMTLNVLDMRGRLLFEQLEMVSAGDQSFQVDISALPSGAYTLHLSTEDAQGQLLFLVE